MTLEQNINEGSNKFDINRTGLLYHGAFLSDFTEILEKGIKFGYFTLIGAELWMNGQITNLNNNNVPYLEGPEPAGFPYFIVVDLPETFGKDISEASLMANPHICSKKQVLDPIKYNIVNNGYNGICVDRILLNSLKIGILPTCFAALVVPKQGYKASTFKLTSENGVVTTYGQEEFDLLYDYRKDEFHESYRDTKNIIIPSEGLLEILVKKMKGFYKNSSDHLPIYRSDGICLYSPIS